MDQFLDRITLRANDLQPSRFVRAVPTIMTPGSLDGGNVSVYGLHTTQLTSGNGGPAQAARSLVNPEPRTTTPLLDEPLVQRPNRTSIAQGFDIDIDTSLT
ncbi:hypothetical protein [Rhodococcus sovatensis]|uniref:Uncharacterized protein n=1 Tax=Rhodococcus sovatensis TaxID=1805840 RepID=A0ABZ2PFB4_9NOCA